MARFGRSFPGVHKFVVAALPVASGNVSLSIASSSEDSSNATLAERIVLSAVATSDESSSAVNLLERDTYAIGTSDETSSAATLSERLVASITSVDETSSAQTLTERIVASSIASVDETSSAATVGVPTSGMLVSTSSEDSSAVTISESIIPVVVQQPSGGGRRIPNTYESLEPRLERARKIRRRLAEERKRLAELKKQQTKVERQFKELEQSVLGLDTGPRTAAPPEKPAVQTARADRANLLEAQIKEYADRVALQAAKVRALRKEMDQAQREASDRNATEAAMEAYRAQQAQSEWERIENERLQQEADDEEMQMLLTLVHEDAL